MNACKDTLQSLRLTYGEQVLYRKVLLYEIKCGSQISIS